MKHPVRKPNLAQRVIALIENAKRKVGVAVNLAQVYTNYEIGRQIVEEEQSGKKRAGYGEKVLIELSAKLTARFGRGWSVETLTLIRKFFIIYSDAAEISQTVFTKSGKEIVNGVYEIENPISPTNVVERIPKSPTALRKFTLSWSHYLLLMRIKDPVERAFFEREAATGGWSFRDLDRQISSSMFERLEAAKGKKKVRTLMNRPAPMPETAEEPMKDPYVLEFLGLPDSEAYDEKFLEDRIIEHLQQFMLELGKGFTFVGRQLRFSLGVNHFRPDLVFYNRFTRSFFVMDLKLGKVTNRDLGQMQTYVHHYDRNVKLPEENPTIGILLSSQKVDDAVVELTLPESEQNRIFVKQYSDVMPSKDALRRIVIEDKKAFEKRKLLALAASKKGKSK